MSSIFDGEDTSVGILWLLTEIAAINWALVEFFDYNIVTELTNVAGGATAATAIYAVIGIAGTLALLDSLGVVDMAEVVGDVLP